MKPKNIFFSIVFLFFAYSLIAQDNPEWLWSERGGSSAEIEGSQFRDYGMERIVNVAVDNENNYYYLAEVGGYTFTLGDMEFETYNDFSQFKDIFIFSTDAEGNYRWSKIIGGGETEHAVSLVVDEENNIYVSGDVRNLHQKTPVHFDTDTIMDQGTDIFSFGPENKSAFIIKYNSEGEYQWVKMPGDDNAPQLSEVEAGFGYSNACILKTVIEGDGTTHSLMFFAPGTFLDGQLEVEEGNRINAIVTYDSEGDLIDFLTLDMSPKYPAQLGVAFYKYQMVYDPNRDRYYIADTYRDNPDPNDPLSINGYGAETVVKGFYLAAIDNQGDVLWYHENHTQNPYSIGDLQLDSEGNIYFTGSFQSDTGQDSFAGYVFEMGDNFTIQNPFLIKLDSDGNLIWGTNAIRYSPFNGQSIVINGDDVYLGLGMLHNTWNDVEITSPVNQGLIPDIQIMRFDAQTGEAQEVIDGNVTTPSQDAIMAMAMDYNGDLVVGGYFGSDLFYDTDLHIHNNAVDSDFFIAKYHTGEEMGVKNQNLQTVKIYPNPTTGVLNLQSKTNLESYQLYDLQGRIVKQGKLIDKQIDLSGVDNGLYFLRVRDQTGNVENLKVVKES